MFYVLDTTFISIIFSIVLPFVILYTLVCNNRSRLAPPLPPQQQHLPHQPQENEQNQENEDEEDNENDNQLDQGDPIPQLRITSNRVFTNWRVFSLLIIRKLVKIILTFRTQQIPTYYARMSASTYISPLIIP